MFILGEALQRLQVLEYFDRTDLACMFANELKILQKLRQALLNATGLTCQQLVSSFTASSGLLLPSFKQFVDILRSKSETCSYWDNVAQMNELLRNLIRADREGN